MDRDYTLLPTGTLLQSGRYLIRGLIGRGGMGAVYLAWDSHLAFEVAVKETSDSVALSSGVLKLEARLLRDLEHPALPRVIDYFEEEVMPSYPGVVRLGHFLVMKYIHGKNLQELLAERAGPFDPEQVLAWADQLLDVLSYLHERPSPIIHRDIKPTNLKLLMPGGKIVLLDFGLSKSMDEGTKVYGRSYPYSPPEQVQYSHTDPRSDLYALAATLYHLLTDVPPPGANQRAERLSAGEPDPLEPPHVYNPRVPSHVSVCIMTALALERARRHEAAAVLRAMLRGEAAQSPWPSVGTTLPANFESRTPRPPKPPRHESVTHTHQSATPLTLSAERTLTARGVVQCVAFSPPGEKLAVGTDLGEVSLWDLRLGASMSLGRDTSAVNTLAFSRDGLTVACGRQSKRVQLWNAEQGESAWGFDTACTDVHAVAFSLDGRMLVTGGVKPPPTVVQMWELNSLQYAQEFKRSGHYLTHALCFSPDGRTLACALWSGERWKPPDERGQIYLWEPSTGEGRLLATGLRVNAIAFSPDGTTLACGCLDSAIRFFDVRTSDMVRTLTGHRNQILSVAFSPDGRTLASADADVLARTPGEVRLWEWQTWKLTKRYERHAHGVRSVAFSPDGRHLAYASDRQVKVIRVGG